MIEFKFDANELSLLSPQTLSKTNDRKTYVEPFTNNCLNCSVVTTENKFFIAVYEATTGAQSLKHDEYSEVVNQEHYEQLFDAVISLNCACFIIEIVRKPTPVIRIINETKAIIPFYFFASKDCLIGSWDIDFVLKNMDYKRLNWTYILNSLSQMSFSSQTTFNDVYQLLPKTYIDWGVDGLYSVSSYYETSYPETDESYDSVSVFVNDFKQELIDCFAERPFLQTNIASELSGGLDSSVITAIFGTMCPNRLYTNTVQVSDNRATISQLQRVKQINEAVKGVPFIISAADYLPNIADYNQVNAIQYNSENYYAAFDKIWREMRSNGCHAVLSGHGGDDLFLRKYDEPLLHDFQSYSDEDRQQKAACFESILTPQAKQLSTQPILSEGSYPSEQITMFLAMSRHSPLVMHRGLWPVYGFNNDKLFAISKNMPFELKKNKTLYREILRTVLSDVSNFENYAKENFLTDAFMAMDKFRQEIESVSAGDMFIYQANVVDRKVLLKTIQQYYSAPSVPLLDTLIDIFQVEAFLKFSQTPIQKI